MGRVPAPQQRGAEGRCRSGPFCCRRTALQGALPSGWELHDAIARGANGRACMGQAPQTPAAPLGGEAALGLTREAAAAALHNQAVVGPVLLQLDAQRLEGANHVADVLRVLRTKGGAGGRGMATSRLPRLCTGCSGRAGALRR